ncbi:hypothetical protein A3H22_02005 [Candidatus Peribacteria bacterium RIFCSPLOWO2_12_FULL_55_15]|nr:MAG: hypothetical protein A2789_03085 [Candidatus Peribacteria bacterium RIFCSPHIGHO2_01_FULL_54_22]OGJ68797.1 MAG: hypothetical protein A2947_03030 [Candidatus Peribacteria bacterium RIFCSPLOWO2_01_FULL_54_110]OGJ69321.1 MAG: hypothetical protein A3H90_00730 [Candidatus Peribacteria bacterium RIFCSPLOWO2_02_FULL_55_36]OGJ70865.1 MAG: hypothetical protein A3H22_02005 [Candidatus Peribacteria bacterium RIFCSPLOWO2_12_FULL_55_15]
MESQRPRLLRFPRRDRSDASVVSRTCPRPAPRVAQPAVVLSRIAGVVGDWNRRPRRTMIGLDKWLCHVVTERSDVYYLEL